MENLDWTESRALLQYSTTGLIFLMPAICMSNMYEEKNEKIWYQYREKKS